MTDESPLRVAIIGAGPSGFYAAGQLLAVDEPSFAVDLYDRLPTPYGLVRSGVAPDRRVSDPVPPLGCGCRIGGIAGRLECRSAATERVRVGRASCPLALSSLQVPSNLLSAEDSQDDYDRMERVVPQRARSPGPCGSGVGRRS